MKTPNSKGVFVLGMHRSGTSALVLGLESLGLALCTDEDRLRTGQGQSNPDHGESMTVIAENEAILASFEGSWVYPKLPPRWLKEPELHKRQRVAGIGFKRAFPNEPWACKDPRMSLTLPYWDAVLGRKYPVVLILRNPLEIVESLKRREPQRRHTISYYLSLWERYTRAALENSKSRPVFIANYDDLLTDWAGVKKSLRGWLNEAGIQTGLEASSPISQKHRHENASKSLDGLSDEQKRLYKTLISMSGGYQNFIPPDLGPESSHTKTLFGANLVHAEAGFSSLLATWPRFALNVDWKAVRRYVTSGVVAAAVLSVMSAVVMYWSGNKTADAWNDTVMSMVAGIHFPFIESLMKFVTNLSAATTINVIGIVAVGVLMLRKKGVEAATLLVALVLENLIVTAFRTPAPVPLENFAGRVFRMVVIFGLLSYLTYKSAKSMSLRVEATILYLVLIGLTCASRVYESARYPSAVLAAAFLGGAVLVILVSCYEAFIHAAHRSNATR